MKFTIRTVFIVVLLQSLESNAQTTACTSNPCLNNGVCLTSYTDNNIYYCWCSKGYTGVQCEISLPGTCDPSYVCIHGNCSADRNGNPSCICKPGYTGDDCSSAIQSPCHTGSPCQNGGACFTSAVDSTNYFCFCTAGWTGIHCQTTKSTSLEDLCEPNPCLNGVCTIDPLNPSGYYCTCEAHFSGANCSTDNTISCSFGDNTYNNRDVREEGCNLCTCLDGDWSCTESLCDGTCVYEDMVFMENDYREEDCNTCYCLHGQWMCTTQQCFNGNECYFREGESDVIELYVENDYRWEECNVCYCIGGLWACATKSCSNRTVINVSFEFDGNFADILNLIEPFKIVLLDDISMTYNIPKNVIEQTEVSEKFQKIKVSFSLVGSQDGSVDVEKMLPKIQTPINNGDYIFPFNGQLYQSRPNSFISTQIWPENPSKEPSGVDSTVVLIVVCGVTGIGFIVIILGVNLYIRTANTKRRDTKYGNAKLPNRRTGLDNGDHTRLTKETSSTLPSNLHI